MIPGKVSDKAMAGVHYNATIFQKIVQLLAYADDTDIIGHTKRNVTSAFSDIERDRLLRWDGQ